MVNSLSVRTSDPSYPINLVGKTGQAVYISIHNPSQYICANCEQILPDWKQQQFLWVIVVLQQSKYPLVEMTGEIETEKDAKERKDRDLKFKAEMEESFKRNNEFKSKWYYPILKETVNPLMFFTRLAAQNICNTIVKWSYSWRGV